MIYPDDLSCDILNPNGGLVAFYQYGIQTARRLVATVLQILFGSGVQFGEFGRGNAVGCAAVSGGFAVFDFYKQNTAILLGNNVNFAVPAMPVTRQYVTALRL